MDSNASLRARKRRRLLRRRMMAALCLVAAVATTTAFVAQEAWEDEEPTHAVQAVQGSPGGLSSTSGPTSVVQDSGTSDNVYAAINTGEMKDAVSGIKPRVYVPNNGSNTVDVIDPSTYRVIGHFDVGYGPQHITPSWDLKHLYVGNTYSNTITVIDPHTGKPVGTKHVFDTYNLYFTPDGTKAIDVAERMNTLFVYDPHTWKILDRITIPWAGADHLDFSADGSYLLLSTEYAGRLVKVDLRTMKVTGSVALGGSPVDVKVSPDGRYFFVANQIRDGVSVVDPDRMKEVAFIPTGKGAHGFCVSRDARSLYVANRLAGTISVMEFATHRIEKTWNVGGSPDMLQVTPDGRQLWVSNRYDSTVSVIDTTTGKVLHVIRVGMNPHGLTYFPQPGRFSIGHNGVYR
jgi:YVTN family beta-propeller protein